MYMCFKVINLNTNIYEWKKILIHDIPISIFIIRINEITPSTFQ